MIAYTTFPISTVANPGFIECLNVLEPGFKVPSAPTMTARLKLAYADLRVILKSKLSNVDSVVLSTDCWTSRAQDSYITVSVYFIDESWMPQSYVLTTQEMEERHTAQHLASKLEEIIQEWELLGKVTAVVTDNAANILAALRLTHELIDEIEGVTCSAHSIQLAVNKGLQEDKIAEILAKASKVVSHFKHSNVATNALEKAQMQLNNEKKKLIQSCRTRWNSSYFMLERLLENRMAIQNVLTNRSVTPAAVVQRLEITENEWILIEKLIKVLMPLQMATTALRGESVSPISMTRLVVRALLDNHLIDEESSPMCIISKLKNTISGELNKRFGMKWDEKVSNTVTPAQIAEFLDPRFKDLLTEHEEAQSQIHSAIVAKLPDSAAEKQSEEVQSNQHNCLDFLFLTASDPNDL